MKTGRVVVALIAVAAVALAGALGGGFGPPAQAQTDNTDRQILEAFYQATGGDNWTDNTNWLSDKPLGEWHGITTDADGRVTELVIFGNRLTGEIPPELGGLTNLQVLVLDGASLTGEIPPELGGLTNLRVLILSGTQLTGAIPAELGRLTNLEQLALYGTQLTGAIPAALGGLPNLWELNLSSNQLSGAIPVELGGLPSLSLLTLSSNQLTGSIPVALGGLTNLGELDLSSNQLSGGIPAELGDIVYLGRLFLSGNPLTGCIPAGLRGVDNGWPDDDPDHDLDQLGLPDCGAAPPAAEPGAPCLRGDIAVGYSLVVYEGGSSADLEACSSNQLSGGIPAELGDIVYLGRLFLSGNPLTGCIPAGLRGVDNGWPDDDPDHDLDQLGLPDCGAAPRRRQSPAPRACAATSPWDTASSSTKAAASRTWKPARSGTASRRCTLSWTERGYRTASGCRRS